jgi:Family of unknown function (DUF5681)
MDEHIKSAKPKDKRVGYSNPPEHTRFKPGLSGNPRGRPRGALNLATVLARTLREKVVVEENGKRKEVSKLEAAIAQLVSKATSGDGHAIRYLCQLVTSAEERSVVVEPTTQLSETDQKVMNNILKRFQQSLKENKDEPNTE